MSTLIYIIAGEPSGDVLGARLMQALRNQDNNLNFAGIGGQRMQEQGLFSLFPMEEIALMGFAEILPHLLRLRRRLRETVKDICSKDPNLLVTIDSPGFNFRVAKSIKQLCAMPRIHYVAPTVWAYKPERAGKTAALFDHLLTLFPFEPPYFEKENLPAHFVGHPVIETADRPVDVIRFCNTHDIPSGQKLLAVLPGSRRGELKRHMPVLKETVSLLARSHPELGVVIPVDEKWMKPLKQETARWRLKTWVVEGKQHMRDALAASVCALTKSGTITLEIALAHLPMVTYHRVNPLSAWLMRQWILTPWFNLINILEQKPVVPELMQENCVPEKLAEAVSLLIETPSLQEAQKKAFRHALAQLRPASGKMPGEAAAEVVLKILRESGA